MSQIQSTTSEMEGLNSEIKVVTNRSILDKGFVLKKRCGQIKSKELYLQPEPIVTLGYSPISLSELRASSVPGSNAGDRGQTSFFVPSQECLLFFSKVILESSVHITTNMSIVFMQTILRYSRRCLQVLSVLVYYLF
mgnify:CR=1 FL=1